MICIGCYKDVDFVKKDMIAKSITDGTIYRAVCPNCGYIREVSAKEFTIAKSAELIHTAWKNKLEEA